MKPGNSLIASMRLDKPQSYFLFAGAGTGKTAQLIWALEAASANLGREMMANGTRLRVVTYTNAAAEEIQIRLGQDPLVEVSTIHSFAWSLIQSFPKDIAECLRKKLESDISELEALQARGRESKASEKRKFDIGQKNRRLDGLDQVRLFKYSPTQNKPGIDGLAHAEVLQIASQLLTERPLLQELLVGKFPILLVDEVQDTNRHLMDALLLVQKTHPSRFLLGLFGDTMQRIYSDGKADLEDAIGSDWLTPELTVNYRSTLRIVDLTNKIRSTTDARLQTANSSETGTVRLFIAPAASNSRPIVESMAREKMSTLTADADWTNTHRVKTLILEHSLAASRHGFAEFYDAFSADSDLRARVFSSDQVSSGTLGFINSQLLPLADAVSSDNSTMTDKLLREFSPLVEDILNTQDTKRRAELTSEVRSATDKLRVVLKKSRPDIFSVLLAVHETRLLTLPDIARFIMDDRSSTEDARDSDRELSAWSTAFKTELNQARRAVEYLQGEAPFDTHQGVKGLEFDRVMVILDDRSAGGFLFSYEKLFEAVPPSKTDTAHMSAGRESVLDRTLRLFYVACSRARSSLAVVLYTVDPDAAKRAAVSRDWFTEGEIEVVP